MDPVTLSWIERVTQAQRVGGRRERVVINVTTDSREVEQGTLFVARSGAHQDGRAYLRQAFARGAAAALVTREPGDEARDFGGPVLLVDDATAALGRLAAAWRDLLPGKVIAVVGSVGKTTTKDMIGAALRGDLEVVTAPRSYNNHVGVPLTLLSASRSTQAIVVEVGTNAPGEIDALAAIVRPDIAVLTSIGIEHLEGLGDIDGVTREEVAIAKHVKEGGFLLGNGDDVRIRGVMAAVRQVRGRDAALSAGLTPGLDWTGCVLERLDAEPGSRARMRVTGGPVLSLQVPGEHMLRNAVMAYAVGVELGLHPRAVARNLNAFQPSDGRLQVRHAGGRAILDDAYNANPTSMTAAVETFTLFANDRPKVAVLGSMLELGAASAEFHKAIGRILARYGVEALITVGEEARLIADEAERLGMNPSRIERCASAAEACASPLLEAGADAAYLVKGSRGVALEHVVRELCERAADEQPVLSVA